MRDRSQKGMMLWPSWKVNVLFLKSVASNLNKELLTLSRGLSKTSYLPLCDEGIHVFHEQAIITLSSFCCLWNPPLLALKSPNSLAGVVLKTFHHIIKQVKFAPHLFHAMLTRCMKEYLYSKAHLCYFLRCISNLEIINLALPIISIGQIVNQFWNWKMKSRYKSIS